MQKFILIYGLAAGAISIVPLLVTMIISGKPGGGSMVVGYTIMLVALSLIFVAVKRFRDRVRGGIITFPHGLGLGLGIAAVAGITYTIFWDVYLTVTGIDFIGEYTASVIEKKRASGADAAAMETVKQQMEVMKKNYANPLWRLPMTFMEIFPVGVVVSLVSAFALRNPKGSRK